MVKSMTTTVRQRCVYCGAQVPCVAIGREQLERVARYPATRRAAAIAELALHGQCSLADAQTWFDHLCQCCRCWPFGERDAQAMALVDQAFGAVPRPASFNTDPEGEGRDHNATLLARTSVNIRRQDLGVQGWDPISFSDAQGIGYLFPALARYALMPGEHADYAAQLASHLTSRARMSNRFFDWCSPAQRSAVEAVLLRMIEARADVFHSSPESDHLLDALSLWGSRP